MGIRDFLSPDTGPTVRSVLAGRPAGSIVEHLERSRRLLRSDDGPEPTQGRSSDGQYGYARDGRPHEWRTCPHCGGRLEKATSDRQQEHAAERWLRGAREAAEALEDDVEHERSELERAGGWKPGSGSRAEFHVTKQAGGLTAHIRGDGGPRGPHTVTIHDAEGKVHDSSHGSRGEAMRVAEHQMSERGKLHRSGWRTVGEGSTQRHVMGSSPGPHAVIRQGYGSEHHLIVNHGDGRQTSTTHADLGAAKAHGERSLRRSERYSEGQRAEVKRRKTEEYGSSETFAVPSLHSYPLTKKGTPSHERVQAAWDYIHQAKNAAKLGPGGAAAAERRIRSFARKHFPDMALEGGDSSAA